MKYNYTGPDFRYIKSNFRKAAYTKEFADASKSTVVLGEGVMVDIAKAPHILVAGATGCGKSVMLHNIIASLLMKNTPQTAELLLIDPKMMEFEYFYQNQPCLYCPVVTDPKEAVKRLAQASDEMMRRFGIAKAEGKQAWDGKKLYIVIDEIADLISAGGKQIEQIVEKIARLGRGAGVHLIVATQHPTNRVLSRQITTNLDTRICLHVNDNSASRLVLGIKGGETLGGNGDAIIRFNGFYTHFQAAFIDNESLKAFSHSWKMIPVEEPKRKPLRFLLGNA